jgi:type IV pilus assembly protein PilM
MLTRGNPGLVGLDFGADSIAAVAVGSNGSQRVERTAIAPLEPGLVNEGDVVDASGLTSAVRNLFLEHRLPKNVRLGVANQRLTMRTIRLPLIEDPDELDTAVRFKAQDVIAMPLDQAVLDYQVVGRGKGEDGERWMEVAAVAGRRDMLSVAIETLREAGLRPVGIDLSAFGMLRALQPPAADDGAPATATLYCSFGDVTNLAVGRGESCLFTRVAAFGYEDIVGKLAERCAIPATDARALLRQSGLDESPPAIGDSPAGTPPATPSEEHPPDFSLDPALPADDEPDAGDARRVAGELLEDGVAKLADEIKLSVEAYGAQEGAASIDGLVLCGPGSTVPGLGERLQQSLGYAVQVRRPPALADLPDAEAARVTVPYGLALEE